MLPVVVEAFGAGVEISIEAARPFWSIANASSRITTSIEEFRSRLLGDRPARALSQTERARLLVELERLAIPRIALEELAFFESFLEGFSALWSRARDGAWTNERYQRAARALAELWTVGSVAATHLETAIVVPHFDAGQRRAMEEAELRLMFPFLEQVTKNDDRVRVNHFALHKFTASTTHPVWIEEAAPPLGWRCRCRQRRISFVEAAERGLRGDFPLGTSKLEEFRGLGGADAGFDRDRFVIA